MKLTKSALLLGSAVAWWGTTSALANTFTWTAAVDGDWSSSAPNNWTRVETVGSTRPGATANVIDTASITVTGAAFTINKPTNFATGAALSAFLLDSTDATLFLNASSVRGLELSDGAVAELKSGTLRIGKGSTSQGAFFINDQLAAGTYTASLKISAGFLVNVTNTSGLVSQLTYTPTNGGRTLITEMQGTLQVGVTDPGIGVNSRQHLSVTDGFTIGSSGLVILSNTRPGADNASASNTTFEVTNGTLVNEGVIWTQTGASNGLDTYFSDPNTYDVNRRDLALQLDNRATGVVSISSVGMQESALGKAVAASHVNSGNIVIADGAKLGLTASNTLTNNATGVIRGWGVLEVTNTGASLANSGNLTPGTDGTAGVLTIAGGFSSTDTAAINIDIGGTAAGTGHDQLVISSGTGMLDGNLEVSLVGFTPDALDTFTVISGTVTGAFDNVVGGKLDLGNGYRFDVAYNPDSVVLSNYAAVPEPGMLSLLSLGGLALLRRRRR